MKYLAVFVLAYISAAIMLFAYYNPLKLQALAYDLSLQSFYYGCLKNKGIDCQQQTKDFEFEFLKVHK